MLRKLGGEFENLKMRIVRFNISCLYSEPLRSDCRWSLVVRHSPFDIGHTPPSVRTVASLVSSFDF